MSSIIYNGSIECPCGRVLTPLEAIFDDVCPQCRTKQVMDSLTNGLNGGTMTPTKGGQ